jgi:hypothetical protein
LHAHMHQQSTHAWKHFLSEHRAPAAA